MRSQFTEELEIHQHHRHIRNGFNPLNKMKKKLVNINLVIIFIGLSIGILGCSMSILDSTKKDDVANWKTYRNEQYGFEFKYPAWLYLMSHPDSDGQQVFFVKKITLDRYPVGYDPGKAADAKIEIRMDSSEAFLMKSRFDEYYKAPDNTIVNGDLKLRGYKIGDYNAVEYGYDEQTKARELEENSKAIRSGYSVGMIYFPKGLMINKDGAIIEIRTLVYTGNFKVDFDKTLSTFRFIDSNQSTEWGPTIKDLKTRLIPLQQQFAIGQPMKFRLEMKNDGNSQIMYDSQQVDVNNAMNIKHYSGKIAPYIAGSSQTAGGSQLINPGEIVTLFDQFDITSQYHISEEGEYFFQFRGSKGFSKLEIDNETLWEETADIPPSNILEINVQPGKLGKCDEFRGSLLSVLPNKWAIAALNKPADGYEVEPLGRQSSKGCFAALYKPAYLKEDISGFETWLTEEFVNITRVCVVCSAYLGKGKLGHVYIEVQQEAAGTLPPEEVEAYWFNREEDIKKAMGIES